MDAEVYYDTVGNLGCGLGDLIRFGHTQDYLLRGGTLADIGIGEGHWFLKLLNNGHSFERMVGGDISKVRLSSAKELLKDYPQIELKRVDIRDLPFSDGEFNQVTALEVLEHIEGWERGLLELLRVASERVVITVPFNQTLQYVECSVCGDDAYISGHINSFTEKTFLDVGLDANINFVKLPSAYSADYYIRRVVRKVLRAIVKTKADDSHSTKWTVCGGCYSKVAYTNYWQRVAQRIDKILNHKPDHLLIQIDK